MSKYSHDEPLHKLFHVRNQFIRNCVLASASKNEETFGTTKTIAYLE